MQRYNVASTVPIAVWPSGNKGTLLVTNDGDNPVWLNDQPITNGWELGPGSSLSWDASRPLYSYIQDVALAGSIVCLENSGSLFNADAVASAILRQGLASDIAAAIYTKGVIIMDNPTTLFVESFHVIGPGGAWTIPLTNLADYARLEISVRNLSGSSDFDNVNVRSDTPDSTFFSRDYTIPTADGGRVAVITVPVVSSDMTVIVSNPSGNEHVSTVTIVGYTRPMSDVKLPEYDLTGSALKPAEMPTANYFASDTSWGLAWGGSNLPAFSWLMPQTEGAWEFHTNIGGSGSYSAYLRDAQTGIAISRIVTVSPGATLTEVFQVPARATHLVISPSGSVSAGNMSCVKIT